ncbi:hypothetical protein LS684_09240 [Cytobacillus spongiae]|uniref:hypothetical protein n=1 Tax=Cytobacillus spongiae TaxID=2901381 RepID=UPI001F1A8EC7|nr:hypothetical protein [Cytobacillus spongiae]UII57588.1 hypothetical protein LS684_09240 [Cytobacillus spongiae]
MEFVYERIIPIIEEIEKAYKWLYDVSFPIEARLIVGGIGSNAYAQQAVLLHLTFALEKISPEPGHIQAIVAHEFGHVTHNLLSNRASMEWNQISWSSPLIRLFQEGVATHFLRKTTPHLKPSIYFPLMKMERNGFSSVS